MSASWNRLFLPREGVFGQHLFTACLLIAGYLLFDLHLEYSHLEKEHTVSILGLFLPLHAATDATLDTLRWVYLISAALWYFQRLVPVTGWIACLSFTGAVSIYWENLPWFRHKFLLPNALLFIFAMWFQFYRGRRSSSGRLLEPGWVYFLSLWSLGLFYGLSGIAKVEGGWPLWDGSALQLWFHLLAEPGHPAREIVIQSPRLAAILQSGALLVELSCLAAPFRPAYRRPLAVLLTSFHLIVEWTFGIPFLTNIPLILLILWPKLPTREDEPVTDSPEK